MAAPIAPLIQVRLPSGPSPVTSEQRYWKSFRSQQIIHSPTNYPVTHISCPPPSSSPSTPTTHDYFAVTTGTRVQIFSIKTRKLVKTITRFTDIVHSGEIRRDGRVLVAGDDTGKIQVFDIGSRAILKTWEEHKQPVWTTKFSPTDLTKLMSASDDRTVRLWDLPSQASTTTFVGHSDYVRCGSFMPGGMSNMIVSGSYDETVRLWDPRAPRRASMIFKHAAPIEAVLPMASGTTVLAAADNQISVLDLVAGKPLKLLKSHQKTVTSLSLASNGTRLVSAGLDGHIKVLETAAWNVVAGAKYPAPILSVKMISSGSSKEDRHLVVGMQSGIMSVKTRLSGEQKTKERERVKEMQALIEGTVDVFDEKNSKKRKRHGKGPQAGKDFVGESAEIVIEGIDNRARRREAEWEKNLRKGGYAQAMDLLLERDTRSIEMLSFLIALRHRSALRAALQGRDENSVQPIFKWVSKHIVDPRYVSVCVDTALTLLDLYSEHVGGSSELEQNIKTLHRRVRIEVDRSQQAFMTGGMLDMLMVGGS